MKVAELQDAIVQLKQSKDVCILAHSYIAREIIEVADYTGDSFQLSVAAAKSPHTSVIMCGVRFMAETVKILSPEKTVYLANPNSGCPMAEQMDVELISAVKKAHPNHTVVAYINTTASLKTICDVCVTSSSAVKIVRAIENDDILFLPDCNLGDYVARQVPEKRVKLLQGGCPIHAAVSVEDVAKARAAHPEALLLVHPECVPAVVELADFVGSTSAIMDYALASDASEFLIGTELSIAENLQYLCAGSSSGKRFYPLSQKLLCSNMKITSLVDVYNCLAGTGGAEITLDADTIAQARRPIDEMLRLG